MQTIGLIGSYILGVMAGLLGALVLGFLVYMNILFWRDKQYLLLAFCSASALTILATAMVLASWAFGRGG